MTNISIINTDGSIKTITGTEVLSNKWVKLLYYIMHKSSRSLSMKLEKRCRMLEDGGINLLDSKVKEPRCTQARHIIGNITKTNVPAIRKLLLK